MILFIFHVMGWITDLALFIDFKKPIDVQAEKSLSCIIYVYG